MHPMLSGGLAVQKSGANRNSAVNDQSIPMGLAVQKSGANRNLIKEIMADARRPSSSEIGGQPQLA